MYKIIFAILFMAGCAIFISCKKIAEKSNTIAANSENKSPVSNAGLDQAVVLPTDSVTLDGSSSFDLDGKIVSYVWTKISGPSSFHIINPDSAKPVVNKLVQGVYEFELNVKDNEGLITKDIVVITVVTNIPPVAFAGFDQIIYLPKDSVVVDATSSYDRFGRIISYSWIKISGPDTFNIVNTSSAKTTINKLVKGTYQFELTVTDNGGLFAKDTIQIIVNSIPTGTGNSSVWFWTRDTVWNYLYININNETKILEESWGGNGDPACYPYGGSLDFDLPTGQYTYKTWRLGRDTLTGVVTVYYGICNSEQIRY